MSPEKARQTRETNARNAATMNGPLPWTLYCHCGRPHTFTPEHYRDYRALKAQQPRAICGLQVICECGRRVVADFTRFD